MAEHIRAIEDRYQVGSLPIASNLTQAPPCSLLGEEEHVPTERGIRIFPSRQSALRLLRALLLEQDEARTIGHRYFDMTTHCQWHEIQEQEALRPQTA